MVRETHPTFNGIMLDDLPDLGDCPELKELDNVAPKKTWDDIKERIMDKSDKLRKLYEEIFLCTKCRPNVYASEERRQVLQNT